MGGVVRIVTVVVAFFIVVAWSASVLAQDADNGWVVIESLQGRKSSINFNHKDHVNLVRPGIDGRCAYCHHKSTVDNTSWHCVGCHGTTEEGDAPRYQDAIHSQCKECHRAKKRGPLLCNECHVPPGAPVRVPIPN